MSATSQNSEKQITIEEAKSCGVVEGAPERLRESFQKALHSKELDLFRKELDSEAVVKFIIPFLNHCPAIVGLNVDNNKIGDGAIALAAIKTLATLNVSSNQIGDAGAIALAANKTLTALDVSGSRIGNAALDALAANNTLTTLKLSHNRIRAAGAIALAANKTLTALDVRGSSFGNAGAIALATNKTLTALNVSYNQIGNAGAIALAANKTLTILDVCYNQIRAAGAGALAANKTLTILDVCYNQFGDAGATALATNKTLTTLNVSSNSIGNAGAIALATNNILTTLNVSSNSIGGDGAIALASNKTLTALNVSSNSIGDAGVAALRSNKTLTALDVYYCQIRASATSGTDAKETSTSSNQIANRVSARFSTKIVIRVSTKTVTRAYAVVSDGVANKAREAVEVKEDADIKQKYKGSPKRKRGKEPEVRAKRLKQGPSSMPPTVEPSIHQQPPAEDLVMPSSNDGSSPVQQPKSIVDLNDLSNQNSTTALESAKVDTDAREYELCELCLMKTEKLLVKRSSACLENIYQTLRQKQEEIGWQVEKQRVKKVKAECKDLVFKEKGWMKRQLMQLRNEEKKRQFSSSLERIRLSEADQFLRRQELAEKLKAEDRPDLGIIVDALNKEESEQKYEEPSNTTMEVQTTPEETKIPREKAPVKLRGPFRGALYSKKLNLSNKKLVSEDVVKFIIPFLNDNPSIVNLNVANNQIDAVGAKALATIKALTALNVRSNQIGDAGAIALAANKTLTALDISHNLVATNGAKMLATNNTLTTLNVSNNIIDDDGATALAANDILTTLNVSDNLIGNEGAKVLASNKTLTTLNVRTNTIGDTGALALMNSNILTLNILFNSISDVGRQALESASSRRQSEYPNQKRSF